ncbi:MAG TPA: hypothetical protein VKU01_24120 [Bryobacteraceae bacterium]|nr:hypothetical protein [Bryobacteraceae bacterium]
MRIPQTLLMSFTLCAGIFQAHAGPPLICHPYNIGSAQSLPWGENTSRNWDNPDPKYNTNQLAADTLRILDGNAPILVRMETMRRAVIYGEKNHGAAAALVATLKQRAAAEQSPALANFDYGYLVATLNQMQWLYKEDLTGGADGYQFVQKALASNDSPDMHYAAAMIVADRQHPHHADYEEHMKKAHGAAPTL